MILKNIFIQLIYFVKMIYSFRFNKNNPKINPLLWGMTVWEYVTK